MCRRPPCASPAAAADAAARLDHAASAHLAENITKTPRVSIARTQLLTITKNPRGLANDANDGNDSNVGNDGSDANDGIYAN